MRRTALDTAALGARLRWISPVLSLGFALTLALTVGTARPSSAETTDLTPSAARATVRLERSRNHEEVLRQLHIERGKSILLQTAYAVKRVSVGDPQTLDVVVLNSRELQLVAKEVGGTNVVLWDSSGKAQAAIDVSIGTAHSHIQGEMRRILGNEDIHVDAAGDAVVLKGHVSSALAVEQALKVVSGFFPGKEDPEIINLLEVGGNEQVMIEVKIAEMDRTLRRSMGSNFSADITTGGNNIQIMSFLNGLTRLNGDGTSLLLSQSVNLAGSFFGFGSGNYQVFLDALNEKGLAKILAEPTLVARSGESASFLAGGEVPIPIAQGGAFGSITIEYKKFGVGIAFTPTVLSPQRIHLQVSPEVSEPDFTFGTTVDGTSVPGFRTRRASTGVELADGQSFAIAGLLRDDVREIANQYPMLGDIPILGALFRSTSFQKEETELVLIVTPHIVKPLGAGPHPLPTDNFVEPNDFEFYLLGRLEGRSKPSRNDSFDQVRAPAGGLIGAAGHRIAAWPEGSN